MRTLTLKINDAYFDKIVSFLEILPKKAVKIEDNNKQSSLNDFQHNIKSAMADIKTGESKILRVIDWKNYINLQLEILKLSKKQLKS